MCPYVCYLVIIANLNYLEEFCYKNTNRESPIAGELVDYIPPRSNIKAAGGNEKLGTDQALGRKRQK
jgi:hypothetical protein